MSRPDEGLIHQWLDGECTPEEAARIERLVATDAEWAAAVTEARGVIAASTRIVRALDAVPRALPAAAAPANPGDDAGEARATRTRGVPRWMGIAAGLVLVAGTAYVLREQSRAPFGSVAPVAVDATPAEPSIAPTAVPTAPPPAPRPAVPEPQAVARQEADAATERRAEALAAEHEASRARVSRAVTRPMAASATQSGAPAAVAPPPVPTLDGCWRVSAPPELVGLLVNPPIRRIVGDTLVLTTLRGDVWVMRSGDVLRGGLAAVQEACRTP